MCNFINDNIIIDFKVPIALQELMDLAETADRENHLGTYIAYADAIDVSAKNCYAEDLITKEMWEKICMRYEQ